MIRLERLSNNVTRRSMNSRRKAAVAKVKSTLRQVVKEAKSAPRNVLVRMLEPGARVERGDDAPIQRPKAN